MPLSLARLLRLVAAGQFLDASDDELVAVNDIPSAAEIIDYVRSGNEKRGGVPNTILPGIGMETTKAVTSPLHAQK